MVIILVIVGLSLLILIHELGHFLSAKWFGVKVEEFGLGFPPRIWAKKKGETDYSINALPFGGFVKIHGEDDTEMKNERSFASQPIWKRSVMVLAGVFMNIVLGWLLLFGVFLVGSPEHLMIADVAKDSPAAVAGIQSGDIVQEARFSREILTDPISIDAFVSLVQGAAGEPIALTLEREKEIITLSVQGRVNPPPGEGSLGVSLAEIGFPAYSLGESLIRSLESTWETLFMVAKGFVNFFAQIFTNPSVVQSITGPVGIFSIATRAGSLGLSYLLELMAVISLNLAVLNLIPFPALDGGRFLLLIFEKIKGAPISRKVQIAVNTAGFIILILLMIIVTVQDIGRIGG